MKRLHDGLDRPGPGKFSRLDNSETSASTNAAQAHPIAAATVTTRPRVSGDGARLHCMSKLELLPDEILEQIFLMLSYRNYAYHMVTDIALVSRRINQACKPWREHLHLMWDMQNDGQRELSDQRSRLPRRLQAFMRLNPSYARRIAHSFSDKSYKMLRDVPLADRFESDERKKIAQQIIDHFFGHKFFGSGSAFLSCLNLWVHFHPQVTIPLEASFNCLPAVSQARVVASMEWAKPYWNAQFSQVVTPLMPPWRAAFEQQPGSEVMYAGAMVWNVIDTSFGAVRHLRTTLGNFFHWSSDKADGLRYNEAMVDRYLQWVMLMWGFSTGGNISAQLMRYIETMDVILDCWPPLAKQANTTLSIKAEIACHLKKHYMAQGPQLDAMINAFKAQPRELETFKPEALMLEALHTVRTVQEFAGWLDGCTSLPEKMQTAVFKCLKPCMFHFSHDSLQKEVMPLLLRHFKNLHQNNFSQLCSTLVTLMFIPAEDGILLNQTMPFSDVFSFIDGLDLDNKKTALRLLIHASRFADEEGCELFFQHMITQILTLPEEDRLVFMTTMLNAQMQVGWAESRLGQRLIRPVLRDLAPAQKQRLNDTFDQVNMMYSAELGKASARFQQAPNASQSFPG